MPSPAGVDDAPLHFPVDVEADPNGVFQFGPAASSD